MKKDIDFQHIKNNKPLATIGNLNALLLAYLVVHNDESITINGAYLKVERDYLHKKKQPENFSYHLHLKSLCYEVGLPVGILQFLPAIDFSQFLEKVAVAA